MQLRPLLRTRTRSLVVAYVSWGQNTPVFWLKQLRLASLRMSKVLDSIVHQHDQSKLMALVLVQQQGPISTRSHCQYTHFFASSSACRTYEVSKTSFLSCLAFLICQKAIFQVISKCKQVLDRCYGVCRKLSALTSWPITALEIVTRSKLANQDTGSRICLPSLSFAESFVNGIFRLKIASRARPFHDLSVHRSHSRFFFSKMAVTKAQRSRILRRSKLC